MSENAQVRDLKRRFAELVRCPRDWRKIVPVGCGDLVVYLETEWRDLAAKHSTWGESRWFDDSGLEIDMAIEVADFDEDERRITAWIENARDQYRQLTASFADMKLNEAYGKHFVSKKLTRREIRALTLGRSKEEGSLFYSGVRLETLREIMWHVLESGYETIADIRDRKHVRLYARMTGPIGASAGLETEWICWDVSFAASSVHPFPISEDEVVDQYIVRCMPDLFDYMIDN